VHSQPEGSLASLALPALDENFGAPFATCLARFTSLLGISCHEPPWGYVAATDLFSGTILWQHKHGTVHDPIERLDGRT